MSNALALVFLCFALSACQNPQDSKSEKKPEQQRSGGLVKSEFETTDFSAIIGGQPAAGDDPLTKATVGLSRMENGFLTPFCAGTLISKNVVLTAQHCMKNQDISDVKILFGNQVTSDPSKKVYFEISKIMRHKYREIFDDQGVFLTAYNDLAILVLKEFAPSWTSPAFVADQNLDLATNTDFVVAGFGITDESPDIQARGLNFAYVKLFKNLGDLLVVDQRNGHGVCLGDSGGPAFLKNADGKLILIGTARGPHNQAISCSNFVEFSNILNQTKFIKDSIQELGGEMPTFYH